MLLLEGDIRNGADKKREAGPPEAPAAVAAFGVLSPPPASDKGLGKGIKFQNGMSIG